MAEDVKIQLAHTKIAGLIKFTDPEEKTVDVPAGSKIYVEAPFSYIEVSRADDNFRIELDSTLADESDEKATYFHDERRFLADDHDGVVIHEYDAPAKGKHTLSYKLYVEYIEGDDIIQEDKKGKITVNVV